MATLTKEENGIICSEYFNESPSSSWLLTPSEVDCLRFENDGLHILSSDEYVTYTFKEPNSNDNQLNYCLIAEIIHVPITKDDIGGIIVFQDNHTYAECQTYMADKPSTIQNYGSTVSEGIDLGKQYVEYSVEGGEFVEDNNSSPSTDYIDNYTNFVDKIYRYIKVIKYCHDIKDLYQFFASDDGINWIEVGNTELKSQVNKIGFFLYSQDSEEVQKKISFIVRNLHIYKNNYITINGIRDLYEFEIYDSVLNRIVLRSDTSTGRKCINRVGNRVIINTNPLYLPIRDATLRLYNRLHYDQTVAEYNLKNYTFGGDTFNISYDVQIRIKNEIIYPGKSYDLGFLYKDNFVKDIVIYNNDEQDLVNLKVSIIAYSEYYSGEEVVKIAFYDKNKINQHPENYVYQDSLTISLLKSHEGREIIVKLSDIPKQEFYSMASEYKFKILIE